MVKSTLSITRRYGSRYELGGPPLGGRLAKGESTSAPPSREPAHGERLSQKVIILTRVGWGLVPHHPTGRDKPCRYAELRQKNLTEQSLKCGHIRVLRQPRDVRRPQELVIPALILSFPHRGMLKNITNVIARSEATWLSRWHSISEIATSAKGELAMTRIGLFQQARRRESSEPRHNKV